VDFVEICNIYVGKMIIKAAKRIFNSGKICRSYSDMNVGVTFFGTQCRSQGNRWIMSVFCCGARNYYCTDRLAVVILVRLYNLVHEVYFRQKFTVTITALQNKSKPW